MNAFTKSNSANKAPSIDELTELSAGPVYVRNTSAEVGPTGADVFITVYVGNQSRAHIISIPLSWKPFNLTEQAPRQAILSSQHFLRAVNTGVLTLLNPADAAAELNTPSAIRETERLQQIQSAVEAAVRNPNADDFKLTLEGEEKADTKIDLSKSFFDEGAVSTSFKAWVSKTNAMDVQDAINAAKVRASFAAEELQYFAENTKHARIRKGLKERMLAAKAAESDTAAE